MSLFLSLFPLYLFGNFHCMGMCGPLVLMIGRHRYRLFYFLGRTLSFTLAGAAAGAAGSIVALSLKPYDLTALLSFTFGFFIITFGLLTLKKIHFPLPNLLKGPSESLSLLLLKDTPWATFLFGFFTVALPCGQTLLVYSACAVYGNFWSGTANGLAFALLTSPSLFLAMHAHALFPKAKKSYNLVLGISSILIGTLALCRGLAEMDIIPHFILNPSTHEQYHIVMF